MAQQTGTESLTPMELEALTQQSRELAETLLEKWPELAPQMFMEDADQGPERHLLVRVPSPTGDRQRTIVVWMDDDTPGIGFGAAWHTHADLWALSCGFDDELDAVVDLLGAIMEDHFVIVRDVGGWDDVNEVAEVNEGVLDLRKRCALEEEMSSRYSQGRVSIRSFTGALDREIGLDDLSC